MKNNEDIIKEYFFYNKHIAFLLNHQHALNGLLESAKTVWEVEQTAEKLNKSQQLLEKLYYIIKHPVKLLLKNKKLRKEINKILDE